MKPIIFLSYRRKDVPSMVGRLTQSLEHEFGEGVCFLDVNSIKSGDKFNKIITEAIVSSKVFLPLIGPNWLEKDSDNKLRIDSEEDYVRREILLALQHNKTIIPVLMESAEMPTSKLLPASLKAFSTYNAARLRNDPDFSQDFKKISSQIKPFIPETWKKYILVSGLFLTIALSIFTVRDNTYLERYIFKSQVQDRNNSKVKQNNDEASRNISISNSLWPENSTLRIFFMDGDKESINFVKNVSQEWLEYINIKFEYINTPDKADVRVTFNSKSDWAYIGTDALNTTKDKATIGLGGVKTFQDEDKKRRTVLHEFGHVLGLNHEHQTPNALQQIDWNKGYAYFAKTSGFNRDQVDRNFRDVTISTEKYYEKPYDSTSVMGYSLPKEILKTPIYYTIRGELSEADIQFISELYPKNKANKTFEGTN